MQTQEIDIEVVEYHLYTIHIVDDSPLVIASLKQTLEEKKYIVTSSTNGKDAIATILKEQPNLVILDVEMPVMDGYETISLLKKNKGTANIPVIFYTSLTKPDVIKKIFQLAASDYIAKPFVKEELFARIEKEMKTIILQNMLKEKMSKLAELLSIDSLTKTSNKMHMSALIKRKLKIIKENPKASFALMYIDIDRFNTFVKAHGIDYSESSLKKIAMIMKRSITDKDTLSRWYGDQFILVIEKTNMDELDTIAKSIREKISQEIFGVDGHLTCSIVIMKVLESQELKHVINKLQENMKEAKKLNNSAIIKMIDA